MEVIFKKIDHRSKDILKTIESDLDNYSAIFFHLSKLSSENKSLYQTTMAVNVINKELADYKGWLLHFLDNDLVVIIHDLKSRDILIKIQEKIRNIFADDRLAYLNKDIINDEFSTIYEFPFNFNNFKDRIRNKMAGNQTVNSSFNEILLTNSTGKVVDDYAKMRDLLSFVEQLSEVDLNNIIRKQAVCAVYSDNNKIKPLFHEVFLSTERLKKLVNENYEFDKSSLTGKMLIRFLNKKLLEFLMHDSRILLGGAVSINLHPELILSDLFSKFHQKVTKNINSALIIEIDVSEVLFNSYDFYQAVINLRELGYKICLDGMSEIDLPLVNREILKVDFGKIILKNDIEKFYESQFFYGINQAIKNFGSNKLILSDCYNNHYISLGHRLEIALFQGIECDRILKEKTADIHDLSSVFKV